jgi:hypothetical protein
VDGEGVFFRNSKIGFHDIYDGTAQTLMVGEQTKRKAFLMELDAPHCDVIVDRWQRFTGKAATLERTGEPFPTPPPAVKEAMRYGTDSRACRASTRFCETALFSSAK